MILLKVKPEENVALNVAEEETPSLKVEPVKVVSVPSEGGGTTDHNLLSNRDKANQHPMSAITGLEEALAEIELTPGPQGPAGRDGNDGEPGPAGADGSPGRDGTDGITPHIGANGNWWIGDTDTGVQAQGKDGYTPVKDVDYFDGEQGPAGPAGEDGQPGADGYTPVKGTDYWTAADKEEIVEQTRSSINIPTVPTKVSAFENDAEYVTEPGVVRVSADVFNASVLLARYDRANASSTTAENFTLTLSDSLANYVFVWVCVRSAAYIMGSQFCPIGLFKQGLTLECNCINDQQNLFIGNAQYVSDTSVKGKVSQKAPSFEVYGVGKIG